MLDISPIIAPAWHRRREQRQAEVVRDFAHYGSWGNSPADAVLTAGDADVVNGLDKLSLDLPGQMPSYGLWPGDAAGESGSFVSTFDGAEWTIDSPGAPGGRPWLGSRGALECRSAMFLSPDASYLDIGADFVWLAALRNDRPTAGRYLVYKISSGEGYVLRTNLAELIWIEYHGGVATFVAQAMPSAWTLATVWGDRSDVVRVITASGSSVVDVSALGGLTSAGRARVFGQGTNYFNGASAALFQWQGPGIASISQAEQQAIHDQWTTELFGRGDYVVRRAMRSTRGLVFGQARYVDVRDLTVDADCEVYTKNQSGSGLIAHGPDAPRLAEGGLLVHPDVTNLLSWSEGYFSSEWTASDLTVTDHADDSADGLHSAALLDPSVTDATLIQSVDLTADQEYTLALDCRRRAADYAVELAIGSTKIAQFVVPTAGNVTGLGGASKGDYQIDISDETVRVVAAFSAAATAPTAITVRLYDHETVGLEAALIERAALYQGDLSYVPLYVRTLSAAATAVAPVYDCDDSTALTRLSSGRYALRTAFELPITKDATIPIWTIYADATDHIGLELVRATSGGEFGGDVTNTLQWRTASGTTEIGDVGAIGRGERCEVSVFLAADGAYRVELLNRATRARYTYSGTLSGWSPISTTKIRLGCAADGTGQGWLLISRFGVLP